MFYDQKGQDRRRGVNELSRDEVEAILSEYHPGDDTLESLRIHNTPEKLARVLRLMHGFEQRFFSNTVPANPN